MAKNFQQQNKNGSKARPPVVVVLGHVDHGKTAILDYIRKTKVAETEAGGITQHIGAYEIEHQGKKITLVDTPGHEAFSAMRSRGARVADIAILVVAAEEGVKPQTKEALSYLKKTGVPMIVAINKIDKPEAQPEKVKTELSKEGILVESMGGNIPSVNVSAKTGQGILELLEVILLVGEMEKLKGNPEKPAQGVVIESYLDPHRGPTATLLIRDGTLKIEDIVGARSTFGKVKILENFQGKAIDRALPSVPCSVVGWGKVPGVGEKIEVWPDMESAQKHVEEKMRKEEGERAEVFFAKPDQKVLNLILKTDVLGSAEAIQGMVAQLPQEKVILRILKLGVGEITERDVKLAQSGKAKIIGFRVKITPVALKLAEREKIKIKSFNVIYELAQGVREMMKKEIQPRLLRRDLGKVKVLVIFRTERNRQIVGGKVIEGEVRKGTKIEIWRKEEKIGEGKLINVQKNKKDVEKAGKGEECGILYEGDTKIEVGDVLVIYIEERRKEEL